MSTKTRHPPTFSKYEILDTPKLFKVSEAVQGKARPYKARPDLKRRGETLQGKARPYKARQGPTLTGEARPYQARPDLTRSLQGLCSAGPGCLYVGCLVYRVIVVVVILVTLLRVGLHLPVGAQVHLDHGSGATSDTTGSKGAKSITNAPPL